MRRREGSAGVELGRMGERHLLPPWHAHELAARFCERFAVLPHEHGGAPVDIALQLGNPRRNYLGACREGHPRPGGLGGLGGRDGGVHMLRRAADDRSHQFIRSRRIADIDAVKAVNALSGDQHGLVNRSFDIAWTGHGVSSVADFGLLLRRDRSVASLGSDGNSVQGKFRSCRSAQERRGLAWRSAFASRAHSEIGAESLFNAA
jgi:hypothetical protein